MPAAFPIVTITFSTGPSTLMNRMGAHVHEGPPPARSGCVNHGRLPGIFVAVGALMLAEFTEAVALHFAVRRSWARHAAEDDPT